MARTREMVLIMATVALTALATYHVFSKPGGEVAASPQNLSVRSFEEIKKDVSAEIEEAKRLEIEVAERAAPCCSIFEDIPYLRNGDSYDVSELVGSCNGNSVKSCKIDCCDAPTAQSCKACCDMKSELGLDATGCYDDCDACSSCVWADTPAGGEGSGAPAAGAGGAGGLAQPVCHDGGCTGDKECSLSDDQTYCECKSDDTEACSTSDNDLCDDAYQSMTGKKDNRAKCCPPTSGCSKTINAGQTAVCSTDCGTNCLGTFEIQNPPGEYKIAFCEFADSGLDLPQCADLV